MPGIEIRRRIVFANDRTTNSVIRVLGSIDAGIELGVSYECWNAVWEGLIRSQGMTTVRNATRAAAWVIYEQ